MFRKPNTLLLPAIVFFVLCASMSSASGQQKVANYSFGKAGTSSYEHLEFWSDGEKRGEVTYAYGSDRREVKLTYLGKDTVKGAACFKVQFPNQHLLFIIPRGTSLEVRAAEGKYQKRFRWEYEGPVNGIGTFCDVCAQDEQEAMEVIQRYFME